MKAYCWASGLIEFGHKEPEGAIVIHTGPAVRLRRVVCALARHGYKPNQLLVPGVPEAEMLGSDPVQALIDFSRRVAVRMASASMQDDVDKFTPPPRRRASPHSWLA